MTRRLAWDTCHDAKAMKCNKTCTVQYVINKQLYLMLRYAMVCKVVQCSEVHHRSAVQCITVF